MSKTRQNVTATQRRSQRRKKRQSVQQTQQTQTHSQRTNGGRHQQKRRNPLLSWLGIAGGLLVLVIIVIVAATFVSNQNNQKAAIPATLSDFQQITNVSPALLNQIASGSVDSDVAQIVKPVKSTPILQGPAGKPEVFYMGGEFCPICAAQRWALTIALSRFGTFEKPLASISSAEDNVPTFTYYKSSYKSNYIDFVPVEIYANSSPNYVPLQKMTAAQQKIVNTYDAPPYVSSDNSGAFPFISVGNQYVSTGTYYSPELLIGQSYNQIIAAMKDPTSDISTGMLGAANYLTAEICQITQNQPGNVCNSDGVFHVSQKLPKTSSLVDPATQLAALAQPEAAWVEQKRS